MKTVLIFVAVIICLIAISVIITWALLASKDKAHEKELEDTIRYYETKISDMKTAEKEKDRLKVEADEKKRNIRTGNEFDNLINGADQLCNKA